MCPFSSLVFLQPTTVDKEPVFLQPTTVDKEPEKRKFDRYQPELRNPVAIPLMVVWINFS